jgi:formylglycine-generating enzyme required for sulfatase activity
VDIPGPTDGQWRVVRGGNWRDLPKDCRSAERSRLPPDSLGNLLGLRLVRTIPEM